MNQNTKQLDKLLTNVINLVKSGSFSDVQITDIYTSDGARCEITRNQDNTFNAKVSMPKEEGLGSDSMEERDIQP
jgi:hypothetical protein